MSRRYSTFRDWVTGSGGKCFYIQTSDVGVWTDFCQHRNTTVYYILYVSSVLPVLSVFFVYRYIIYTSAISYIHLLLFWWKKTKKVDKCAHINFGYCPVKTIFYQNKRTPGYDIRIKPVSLLSVKRCVPVNLLILFVSSFQWQIRMAPFWNTIPTI